MNGITVVYWMMGNKIREHHPDAENFERRTYGNATFDVLLNANKQILASYTPSSIVAVQHHGDTNE
jgi:hypothetical protein